MGMADVIAQIIKLILWVMGYFMKRAEVTMAAKESFYLYVKEMAKLNLVPKNLKQESDRQIISLAERKKKILDDMEKQNIENEKEVPGSK